VAGFVIERLDPADLDRLEPLWGALLVRHAETWRALPTRDPADSWARRRRQYAEYLAGDQGSFVLVARRGESLIGYLMVHVAEGDESYATGDSVAEIKTFVVLPAERRSGTGSALLDAALSEIGRLGIDDVFVGVMAGNDAAQYIYERRGFRPFVHVLYARRDEAAPGLSAESER
jgi:ribosomal protein S18 acetylase RimI-like enzyme